MDKYIKYTKDFYEDKDNVIRYSEAVDNVGLWNSEKTANMQSQFPPAWASASVP